MAKKRTGKAGRKAGGTGGSAKSAKKTARKPARPAAKRTAKRTAKRAAPRGPMPVKTGRGAGAAEIGREVVSGFNARTPDHQLWDRFWSPRAVSVEGGQTAMAWNGRKAMDEKAAWWSSNFTVHSAAAEGPYVGATGFSVKYRMDYEEKASGKREQMEEIGVYTVENGKIVREEFYAGARKAAAAEIGAAALETAGT